MTKRRSPPRLEDLVKRHHRTPSAATWFALGAALAEADEATRARGRDLLGEALADPITCLKRCLRLAPDHAKAWHLLARTALAHGDHDHARRAFARALKVDPHVPAAWQSLAILTLPAAGETAPARVRRAEQYLHRAIEEDPKGKLLGWEPYAWLAEAAERRRDDPDALAWYAEANRRGDHYAGARGQVIAGHGARRRATSKAYRAPAKRTKRKPRSR